MNSPILWLTGLPGSGKTTIARLLQAKLAGARVYGPSYTSLIIDGDELRNGVSYALDFTDYGRMENCIRAAHIALIAAKQGILPICCLVSPCDVHREVARGVALSNHCPFHLVHIDCSIDTVKTRRTLREMSYEPPGKPDRYLDTDALTADWCVSVLAGDIYSMMDAKPVQQTVDVYGGI